MSPIRATYLMRQALSVIALPVVAAVVIPVWLAGNNGVRLTVASTPGGLLLQAAGLFLLVIGIALFVSSLRRFAGEGEGTLAPWDPPRRLVVSGPYLYVRNPMISGVLFVLFGEALILLSRTQLEWALIFLIMNAIYIPLFEETQLRRRFGAEYVDYCRNVNRLMPRVRAWKQ